MKQVYPVILTQDKDCVLVDIPDFDVVTEGESLADAVEMARDAIGLNGITLEDDGKSIPEPTSIEKIDIKNGKFSDVGSSIVSLVDIDFTEYRKKIDNKSVRRNVTLPNWLNREADLAHINVSRVLQDALMEKLNVYR